MYGVKHAIVVVALLIALGLVYSDVFAMGDNVATRPTLHGLQEVYVDVKLQIEGIKTGVTADQLRTDVELKLRLAGIKVASQEDCRVRVAQGGLPSMPAGLNVSVYVRGLDSPDRVFLFGGILDIHQAVSLMRDPKIVCAAVTWDTGPFCFLLLDQRDIRDHVKDLTDQFINAYLSVNPKE